MSETTLLFYIAINDENGNDTGKLRAAQFTDDDDNELFLGCTGRPIACYRDDSGMLRVGRYKFDIEGYGTWVGNMSWDAARVTVSTAEQIVGVLRKSGQYAPESGTSDWWDAWEAGAPMFEVVTP